MECDTALAYRRSATDGNPIALGTTVFTAPMLVAIFLERCKRHEAGGKGNEQHARHGQQVEVEADAGQRFDVEEHVVVDDEEDARGEETSYVGPKNRQLWQSDGE